MKSIQHRLLFLLLFSALIGCGAAAAITYHTSLDEFNEVFDYELRQLALAIRAQQTNNVELVPELAIKPEEDDHELDFFLQMWTLDGTLLFRSHPEQTFAYSSGEGFSTVTTMEGDLRVFTLMTKNRVIQAAQLVEARRHMAVDATFHILVPALLLIPLLILFITFSLRRGLAPITHTARAVGERSANTLQPLPIENLPLELKPLVIAINGLMERLNASLNAQRQFTADAAHELRSPLTALSLQMQLLEKCHTSEERLIAVKELKKGIQRASLLVQQLLVLARLEPDNPRQHQTKTDLSALAKSVALELSLRAETKHIDLGVDAPSPVFLTGDDNSLRTLISNLVDNAIRYTPAGGRIDILVKHESNQAIIEVIDNGPGIPLAERQRVFDRFYRIPGNDSIGSGLGLAIAKAIVDQHQGTISLEDAYNDHGLHAKVCFPVKNVSTL